MTGAVYNQAVYGQELYTSTERTTILWAIEIDWDNDGVFDGSNEAARCVDYLVRRGRPYFVSSGGSGIVPMRPGKCVITLENQDGRFDPYNTSGDLYGLLFPGRMVRVRAKYNGTWYPRFAGKVASITPIVKNGERFVKITCEDGLRMLSDRRVSSAVQTNAASTTVITAVLNAASWPSAWGTDLETSVQTLPYWWASDQAAFEALHDLMYFENGTVFVNAEGAFAFRSAEPGSTVDVDFDESEVGKDLQLLQPWDMWRNYYRTHFYPVVEQSTVELWRLNDSSFLVPAGESRDVWADFIYDGKPAGGSNLIAPAATTDYTANSASDGSGTNLTANMSVAILGTYGGVAKLRVTNSGGGGSDFYTTLLKLRGKAYTQPNGSYYEEDNISTSGIEDRLDFEVDYPFITKYEDAERVTSWYKWVVGQVRLPIFTVDTRPDKQFVDIYDHMRVRADTLGLSQVVTHVGIFGQDFRVGYLEERWATPNGQRVLTTIQAEPFVDLNDAAPYQYR